MRKTGLIRSFLSGLPALALAAACGGGGGGSIALTDLSDEVESTACAAQVACGLYPDMATCLEGSVADSDIDQLGASVDAGRITYDGDKARECLDLMSDAFDCSLFGAADSERLEEVCDAVFTGTVETGGQCVIDDDCAGGAECDTSCPDECCFGTCGEPAPADPAPVGIGQDCSEAPCVEGAYCATNPSTEAEECAALPGEGEPCEGFGTGSCQDGLVCDGFFAMGTCSRSAAEGATCDPALGYGLLSCERSDNWCDPEDTTCKKRPKPGEPCNLEIDNCINYAYCASDGNCAASPGLGDACEVDGEVSCLGDLECDAGLCAAPEVDPICNPTA